MECLSTNDDHFEMMMMVIGMDGREVREREMGMI